MGGNAFYPNPFQGEENTTASYGRGQYGKAGAQAGRSSFQGNTVRARQMQQQYQAQLYMNALAAAAALYARNRKGGPKVPGSQPEPEESQLNLLFGNTPGQDADWVRPYTMQPLPSSPHSRRY